MPLIAQARGLVDRAAIGRAVDAQVEAACAEHPAQIDLRPDLGALVVPEVLVRPIGQCQVRRPRHREAAALGAEDHELEIEAQPGRVSRWPV